MVQRFSREREEFFLIKGLPDSVMVAHKILILGVQVRALVGQNPLRDRTLYSKEKKP